MKKLILFAILLAGSVSIVSAAEPAARFNYHFLPPCIIPGADASWCPPATDIPGYIVRLYQFGVGISGVVAVGMIVAGAIYISISGGVDKKQEGKDMITSALIGTALLFGSWLILKTINPNFVRDLRAPSFGSEETVAATSTMAGGVQCSSVPGYSTSSCPRTRSNVGTIATECGVLKSLWASITGGPVGAAICVDTAVASKVWQHFYYKKGSKPLEIKCFMYAYQEASSSAPEKVSLPSGWGPC